MPTVLSPDLEEDADQLEGRWGIPVAMEMLRERVITPLDFIELCEEAAQVVAIAPVGAPGATPSPVG